MIVHKAGRMIGHCGLGCVLFLLATALLTTCAKEEEPGTDPAALEARITELRQEARFAEAKEVAEELLALRRAEDAPKPHEISDAERLVTLLDFAAALPESTRLELAEADRLNTELSNLYRMGRYAEGAAIGERQLEIRRRLLGPEHWETAASLTWLAIHRQMLADYAGAETLLREALMVRRKSLEKDHPKVAASLDNYANLLCDRGEHAAAKPLYWEALVLRRKALGNDHRSVGISLNNLGVFSEERGDFAAAERFHREALAIRRRALGEEHPDVALSLNNLAVATFRCGQYASAESLFGEANAMIRGLLGDEHPMVAATLGNLSSALREQGDYAGAEPLCRESVQMLRNLLGKNHPRVATGSEKLGALLRARGEYGTAKAQFEEALAIRRKVLGREHPDVVRTLCYLGELALDRREYAAAESILSEAAAVYEVARLRTGPGVERVTFERSPYGSLASARFFLGKEEQAWQAVERDRGRVLANLLLASGRRSLSPDESAQEDSLKTVLGELERRHTAFLVSSKADTTGLVRLQAEESYNQLLSLEARWSTFQQRIAAKYPVTEGQTFDLQRVQAILAEQEALVGWLDLEPPYEVGEKAYWGYVIRNSGPVRWVRLDASLNLPASASWREHTRAFRDMLTGAGSVGLKARITHQFCDTAHDLWQERIGPLSAALEGVTDLIVIPSGTMLGLPVEALMDQEGRFLGDRYSVSYAPSATIHTWLSEKASDKPAPTSASALLLGNPRFQDEEGDLFADADDSTLRSALSGDRETLHRLWPLPWSQREVEAVAPLFRDPLVLVGQEANEPALVHLAETGGLYRFGTIHLATHALVDDEQPERSALVLSLVDHHDALEAALAGQRVYDGLITAGDIARDWGLDTDLVTLSGCETGLGREVSGEGYIGFAHALFQAGARSLLVSLWVVSDEATSLLMRRFYENRAGAYEGERAGRRGEAMPTREALQEAKHWLRSHKDENGEQPWEHPFYWAGFVLFGASR